jgi:hypothetical protein
VSRASTPADVTRRETGPLPVVSTQQLTAPHTAHSRVRSGAASPSPAAQRGGAHAPLRTAAGVLAALVLLATAGGVMALQALTSGSVVSREAPAPGAWSASASFGSVAVERMERRIGAPHGAAHAEPGEGSDEVRVFLTVANRRQRRIPYSPGQFRLQLSQAGTTVSATNPNPPPASVAAGEAIRQQLTFIVPASRDRFALVFDDLGRAKPTMLATGSLPAPRKD